MPNADRAKNFFLSRSLPEIEMIEYVLIDGIHRWISQFVNFIKGLIWFRVDEESISEFPVLGNFIA